MHDRLIQKYGSPLYRYDLGEVAEAYGRLCAALPPAAAIFYSLKANPHPSIVADLARLGARAEVSSVAELLTAKSCGHAIHQCLYTGPGKTAEEIRQAVQLGARLFSAESVTDLRRIAGVARAEDVTAECLLRLNAGSGGSGTSIRMTGRPSQFGFDVNEVARWISQVSDVDGVDVVGMHFFPISNAQSEAALIASFEESLACASLLHETYGLPLRMLDLGGGFAAPYARPGPAVVYGGLRPALLRLADAYLKGRSDVVLAFEAGRYLTAACGSLITTVSDVKLSRGERIAVLDAGINHLGGMSGLRRMLPLSAMPEAAAGGESVVITLAGPLCAPSDVLAHGVRLHSPAPGDVLEIPNVGAYGLSASLIAFLGRVCPAEVVVRDGDVVSATRITLVRDDL
ncbi:type III PLP-dependent enzyme domain-containing protein [Nonomuraea montanisoli]|nr:type III PLP-dependent enzyme [Nonomuraea montanisoli]